MLEIEVLAGVVAGDFDLHAGRVLSGHDVGDFLEFLAGAFADFYRTDATRDVKADQNRSLRNVCSIVATIRDGCRHRFAAGDGLEGEGCFRVGGNWLAVNRDRAAKMSRRRGAFAASGDNKQEEANNKQISHRAYHEPKCSTMKSCKVPKPV